MGLFRRFGWTKNRFLPKFAFFPDFYDALQRHVLTLPRLVLAVENVTWDCGLDNEAGHGDSPMHLTWHTACSCLNIETKNNEELRRK